MQNNGVKTKKTFGSLVNFRFYWSIQVHVLLSINNISNNNSNNNKKVIYSL